MFNVLYFRFQKILFTCAIRMTTEQSWTDKTEMVGTCFRNKHPKKEQLGRWTSFIFRSTGIKTAKYKPKPWTIFFLKKRTNTHHHNDDLEHFKKWHHIKASTHDSFSLLQMWSEQAYNFHNTCNNDVVPVAQQCKVKDPLHYIPLKFYSVPYSKNVHT